MNAVHFAVVTLLFCLSYLVPSVLTQTPPIPFLLLFSPPPPPSTTTFSSLLFHLLLLLGNGAQASCGVGELLARHVVGAEIPAFGQQLLPGRFLDKAYCDELSTQDCKGQI